jgi:hypothetical protein
MAEMKAVLGFAKDAKEIYDILIQVVIDFGEAARFSKEDTASAGEWFDIDFVRREMGNDPWG